jgi:hypothetical protein
VLPGPVFEQDVPGQQGQLGAKRLRSQSIVLNGPCVQALGTGLRSMELGTKLSPEGKAMAGFKKPFKAVPLNLEARKRLKGLEEFDRPLWSPPRSAEAFPWVLAGLGLLIGVCGGLAYVLV